MNASTSDEPAREVTADLQTMGAGLLTELRLFDMVFPEHTNHYGTLLGGRALYLMDTAAFMAASRFARHAVVTASSERVEFERPVREGQLLEVLAQVVGTGKSSIRVEVRLFAEDLLTGERQLCTHGRFILVAVDGEGRKTVLFPSSSETSGSQHDS